MMSGEKDTDTSRRKVLKTMGAAGAAGMGTSVFSTSATAKTGEVVKLGIDLTDGNVLDVLSDQGVGAQAGRLEGELSASVRTGSRLLETLNQAGIVRTTSLDQLGKRAYGVYGTADGNAGKDISFKTAVANGTLQITFGEAGTPFAAFYPEDDRRTTLFVLSGDGETYERIVHDPDDVTVQCGSSCGGCTCGSWCRTRPWKNRQYCQSCSIDDECITQRSCTC